MANLTHEPSFVFRNLKEEELESWFDHVSSVFAQTPRQYFVDHFNNDPHRNLQAIFVAFDEAVNPPVIAATVRVFEREMFVDGKKIKVGGIGEVSTKEAYQRRKLAQTLLNQATEFMKKNEFEASTLHTGAAAPLYQKLGYVDYPRETALRTVESLVGNEANGWSVESTDFNDENQVKDLVEMHSNYSSKFNGAFNRNAEYWKKWIPSEIFRSEVKIASWLLNSAKERIAFVLIGYKPRKTNANTYLIRSFLVNDQLYSKDQGKEAFHFLVKTVLEQNKEKLPHPASHVMYPSPLFNEHGSCETDLQLKIATGAMYVTFDPSLQLELHFTLAKHVFWDADGF